MRKSVVSKLIGMTFATALAVGAATAWAADTDEATGGYGPYYGMGPGMMGGYGMGPGMMGGYGMGPGMMGGYGMGPGMMGGYGMGPGMMGYGALGSLNLTDQQRTKINHIFDTVQKQHWAVMGQMMEQQNKLRDLYSVEEPDPKKVGAVYGQIGKLRQQMIETQIQASNQAQQVLTKEQRERLREWKRGEWGPGWGPRAPDQGPRAPDQDSRDLSGRHGMMGPGGTPGMMGR